MIKKKLIPALMLSLSLFSCVAANAAVVSESLTGTSAESSYFYLGAGDFTLTVDCTTGSGTGRVMKIIPYAPDRSVANASVAKPNSGTATFTAVDTNDAGDDQSYYLRWNGRKSTSAADLSID